MAAGEAAAARGRAGVEAKLGALTSRLLHMARKEAKREKRRGVPLLCVTACTASVCSVILCDAWQYAIGSHRNEMRCSTSCSRVMDRKCTGSFVLLAVSRTLRLPADHG